MQIKKYFLLRIPGKDGKLNTCIQFYPLSKSRENNSKVRVLVCVCLKV